MNKEPRHEKVFLFSYRLMKMSVAPSLPWKSVLFSFYWNVASQVGGKADVLIKCYTATLQCSLLYLLPVQLHVWCFPLHLKGVRAGRPPPLLLLLLAELHCKLQVCRHLSYFKQWCCEVETCEESGWLTLHSPSIYSLYPCFLLPAEGEETTAEAWLPGRGYYGVSVTL